jgi:hypothetical protein
VASEALAELQRRVSGDPAFAQRLRALEPERFVAEVMRESARLGLDVSEDDLRGSIARGRHAWVMRWIR